MQNQECVLIVRIKGKCQTAGDGPDACDIETQFGAFKRECELRGHEFSEAVIIYADGSRDLLAPEPSAEPASEPAELEPAPEPSPADPVPPVDAPELPAAARRR